MAQENYLKKPKSAYIHFCNENRDGLKNDNPELTPKQVLSKLGELWQELKKNGGDEFKKYNDMALEDKKLFEKLKAENPDAVLKPRKIKKNKKTDDESVSSEEDKPKKTKTKKTISKKETENSTEEKKPRKLNGYIKYLQANRVDYKKDNPSLTSKQVTSELATAWKGLTDVEKLKWKES